MIVADGCDDGDDGRDGVRRIEASAHAGLEHNDLAGRAFEMPEGKRGGYLEEGGVRIPRLGDLADSRYASGDFIVADHLAVHLDAFAVGDEVRGGEEAAAVTSCAQDRVDHRADGAFAVRARDVDDALRGRG